MLTAIRLRPIRRLIRNSQTGLFLTASGEWTLDESQAASFDCLWDLVRVCTESELHHSELHQVEMLLKFGGGRYDLCLPICREQRVPEPETMAQV